MAGRDDSDFDSARKWSHSFMNHPPKEKGINWLWIIIISVLLLLAIWWWWSIHGNKKNAPHSECSPIDNLERGAKSIKDHHMTVDRSGRAAK